MQRCQKTTIFFFTESSSTNKDADIKQAEINPTDLISMGYSLAWLGLVWVCCYTQAIKS